MISSKQTVLELTVMESKIISISKIYRRLLSQYGRKSLLRHLRDAIRPNHSTFIVEVAGSVNEFWELAHRGRSHLWLSGTPPLEVFERLKISEILKKKNLRILNVGVGEGYCTSALSQLGHYVDALDISLNALTNVEDYTENQFVDASDLSDQKYDLILHHLVAQHMSHSDLSNQLRNLIRSLKAGGLLALQFVSSSKNENFITADDDLSIQMHGGVFRSSQFMTEMVRGCGGNVIDVYKMESWEKSDTLFQTVHAQR